LIQELEAIAILVASPRSSGVASRSHHLNREETAVWRLNRLLGIVIPFVAKCLLAASTCAAQEGAVRGVHDPCLIKANGVYYLYSTGRGVPIRRSRDLFHWERAGRVFDKNPSWFKEAVPGSGWVWAPDISSFDKGYRLYYSVSSFGSNRSCIGMATNATLDPDDIAYKWVDVGPIICSTPKDDWNAIDPNFVRDRDNQSWLSFGSFWSGIKLVRLDDRSGAPLPGKPELRSLASRPEVRAVEAPFVVPHGSFYYLFVSFDRCCRGVESTYKIMAGRSHDVTGPYLDRSGRPMLEGGGTAVLVGHGRIRGPGHNAIFRDRDREWFVHHFYDADARGAQTLQIRPLRWSDDDWPQVGEPITAPVFDKN
jgi:arabinan endo-1,5-alpha-L-arabinosidase